jgi:hypothetical protein
MLPVLPVLTLPLAPLLALTWWRGASGSGGATSSAVLPSPSLEDRRRHDTSTKATAGVRMSPPRQSSPHTTHSG